jgi:hypothetical protein
VAFCRRGNCLRPPRRSHCVANVYRRPSRE